MSSQPALPLQLPVQRSTRVMLGAMREEWAIYNRNGVLVDTYPTRADARTVRSAFGDGYTVCKVKIVITPAQ